MKEYEVYRETGYLDLVAVIKARTYKEAREEAKKMGYGKGFRIEEVEDDGLRILREAEAYGDDLHDSFLKRYEFAPEFDYMKGRWKR